MVPPASAMPPIDTSTWSARLRSTLQRYDEPLLREVANKLCKPRNQWPAEELIDRCLATMDNPTVIDRRLSDLDLASLQLLALIGHSRQPRWRVGNLVEMAVALGHDDGLAPVVALLEAGLLYPDLPASMERLKSFEFWLGQSAALPPAVVAPPDFTARAMGHAVEFPPCPGVVLLEKPAVHETDGIDLPLRIATLWQKVHDTPLRRTQTAGFFKRDRDRLRTDPILNAVAPDALTEVQDPALLPVVLAAAVGVLTEVDGELHAGDFPAAWDAGLPATLASLWTALLQQSNWNPKDGWEPDAPAANPYPSAWLLTLLLLSRLPADAWAGVDSLEKWMSKHHPYWRQTKANCGLDSFILGVAYALRLIQAAPHANAPAGRAEGKEGTAWLVRLSPMGRWLLGLGPIPATPAFPQTILVQPNLEILAYRQGLTPALIARLAKLANWKTLGAACTLQLEPSSVYRALESGESFETIQQTLQRHGMKTTPDTVVNALRTWANKRERIRVYTAGALFEFNTPNDMADALARGLPAVGLSDRLAVVANDSDIDYRHFRLTATRDFGLPPERCVEVDDDGVTLGIDLAKSDLLIETEVGRFAQLLDRPSSNGRRYYQVTTATLGQARDSGLNLQTLETWFLQRSGQPLPPATKLLFSGSQMSPYELRRPVVLHVPTAEIADGLMQWRETRALIANRLGPTALAVAEDKVAALQERLKGLGVEVSSPE
jgi:Helicase conserved C-terminal domain